MSHINTLRYKNPVWDGYLADPFVLKDRAAYYAYGTGPASEQGRQFPVLRSPDLVHWEAIGHTLLPLSKPRIHAYWAPEVAVRDGQYYLYYSASATASDEGHRLRVAVAQRPEGPFEDCGRELLPQAGFSIDAHPFRDPRSGQWYLYFATDYLEDEPHGTGLAVVPLADDLLTPLDAPRAILRASCAWQIYQRNRHYKGRIWPAWYTLEGPFVIFHADRYWCLYSGGAWNSENYGMACASAPDPMGPWTARGSDQGPTVLRGNAQIIGPGHASVTTAPDGSSQVLVYHAWDPTHTARRMCIDPLVWTADGPRCDGPSLSPRSLTQGR